MKRAAVESTIQRDIEAAIGSRQGVLLLRNSVGRARYAHLKTGAVHFVPYGLGEGSPDLVLFIAPWGRAVGLEVKAPGQALEPHQEKCHRIWRSFGVHVETVRSVNEAVAAVERAIALDPVRGGG